MDSDKPTKIETEEKILQGIAIAITIMLAIAVFGIIAFTIHENSINGPKYNITRLCHWPYIRYYKLPSTRE